MDFDEKHTPRKAISASAAVPVPANDMNVKDLEKGEEDKLVSAVLAITEVQRSNNDASEKSSEDYDSNSDFDDDDDESVVGVQVSEQRPLSSDSNSKSLTSRPQSQSNNQFELLSPPANQTNKGPSANSLLTLAETSPFDRIKLLSGASRRALREKSSSSSGKVKKVRGHAGGQASLSSSGSFTHYLTVVDGGVQQLVT